MARRAKFLDETQIKELRALAAYLTTDQLADHFGMARSTFMKRMAENALVRAAYDAGRSKAIADVAKSLIASAKKGNVVAQIFFLKTQAGWRDTPPEDPGTEAPPLQITIQAREAVGNVRITRADPEPERPAGDLPE